MNAGRTDTSSPTNTTFKTFSTAGVNLIHVILCGGDDHATIAGNIDTTAILDGGDGDDHLNGGGGSNIVLGGTGADTLTGGAVRDMLIGGFGIDRQVGHGGQDLLLGNATIFDSDAAAGQLANRAALRAIQNEWNADHRSIAARRANIAGTGSDPRLNDDFFLKLGTDATLVEDLEDDLLTGSADEDWFVLLDGDIASDFKAHQGDLLGF